MNERERKRWARNKATFNDNLDDLGDALRDLGRSLVDAGCLKPSQWLCTKLTAFLNLCMKRRGKGGGAMNQVTLGRHIGDLLHAIYLMECHYSGVRGRCHDNESALWRVYARDTQNDMKSVRAIAESIERLGKE